MLPFICFLFVMYNYPSKTNTNLTIPTKWGDITYLIEEQSSEVANWYIDLVNDTQKTNNFIDMFSQELKRRKFLWNIIKKKEVWFSRRYTKLIVRKLVYRYLHLYETQIVKLMFPMWKSLYEKMPEVSNNWHKRVVFNCSDEVLSEKTNIPIDEIDKRLTLRQKQRRIDKSTYDYYESFKRWEEVNAMVRWQMPLSESEKSFVEMVKKQREKKRFTSK